ncbi:MAG TPA: twin-arginine translocase TatA/TatE family subunit [Candidatus Paceibacterota bacterium]|nr:twin-arginine translocase TatA/TatE family subunit [Candidatus Paceibacterota bacterium]
MFGLGIPEVLVILIVFAILFFGSGKVVEFARSLGKVAGEFKKGKREMEDELRESEKSGKN